MKNIPYKSREFLNYITLFKGEKLSKKIKIYCNMNLSVSESESKDVSNTKNYINGELLTTLTAMHWIIKELKD